MGRVADEVRRFVRTRGVCGGGVVAVSGGADSVALLRALVEADAGPLTVAHVNHLLRGADSDADETFVAELAARLKLGYRVTRIDVATLGGNLEATARDVRYGWLAGVAAEVGAVWVATGHTADDQAETVLHRLVRGAGLQGLRGIAAVRGNVVRPLLGATRTDVVEYLADLGQPFRTDASNADPRFTRNRIRAEVLPLLRTFNPDVVAVLGRLAEQASDAFDVLEEAAVALLLAAERPRAGGVVVLDAATLTTARPYLVREAVRLVWRREGWPADRMTFDHWNRLVTVARGALSAADFPGGVTARHVGRVVRLGRRP